MPILDPFEDAVQYFRGIQALTSAFRVGRNLAQNIGAAAWTVIQWDAEYYDLLNEMLIVNPWTFTPTVTGYYYFYASCRMDNMLANEVMGLSFYVDAAANINTRTSEAHRLNQQVSLNIAGAIYLVPTNVVDVRVFHAGVGNRPIAGNVYESMFVGWRLG